MIPAEFFIFASALFGALAGAGGAAFYYRLKIRRVAISGYRDAKLFYERKYNPQADRL